MKHHLPRWFNLRSDQAPLEDIDASVRAGASASGTNLWVLFFAMLIASVGLNVNSTAVIIGAMLISPLMGPIVGVGYGAALFDLLLIRRALVVLGLFTGLSLLTSTLYFLVSPLREPGTELLARTVPTLWDVLIAAFGGAAGMVALTRRGFNNILPGVAIATALMPPLCTVGFGIANARWDMALGAAYLFTINAVFIAAAALAVARAMQFPPVSNLDASTRIRHRWVIGLGLSIVLLPSVVLGTRMVQEQLFTGAAQRVVSRLERSTGVAVLESAADTRARMITLTVVGAAERARLQPALAAALWGEGLPDAQVNLRLAGEAQFDEMGRRADERDRRIARLAADVHQLRGQLDAVFVAQQTAAATPTTPSLRTLQAEALLGFPAVQGLHWEEREPTPRLVRVRLIRTMPDTERRRLEAWLTLRLNGPIALHFEPAPPSARRHTTS